MPTTGTLIFFCGKMGAGKLTKSKEVSITNNAVLLSEDEWLSVLYPEQISSLDNYIRALLKSTNLEVPISNILQKVHFYVNISL